NPRERRQVLAEEMLDEREVCTPENGAMRQRLVELAQQSLDAVAHQGIEVAFRRFAFDRAGELRAYLLNDGDLRAAFADLLRVDAGSDRSRRPEDRDGVGIVLLRVLR